jgi:hypothetical protein
MEQQKRISLRPPAPHSNKQKLIMSAFMFPEVTEIWVCCGTKFGKTAGAAAGACNGLVSKTKATWRWVAPIYEQSKIGFDYCRQILPPEPTTTIRKGNLELEIPGLESILKFHHAQNPVSLEGAAISGYIFDEAAKMNEDVYASAKTTRTVTRGPMMFISTPYGKNWFYRHCMDAREEMVRAEQEGRMPTKLFIRARTQDNPQVPRQSIEEARKEMPARLFRQYYMAEFVDDGSVFTGYNACLDGPYIDLFGEHQHWFHETASSSNVVIGVDWAKMTDWTVFIAIAIVDGKKRVVGFERFHRKTYTEAIRQLVRFSKRFKEVDMIFHDKTGVGVAIDDQLAHTDLTFTGITFTNSNKSEMVNKLMTSFEQEAIIIPRWNILLKEIESFEVTVSSMGTMRYQAATGGHDDIVCALMLANQASDQYGDEKMNIKFLEELPFLKKDNIRPDTIEAYYQDIIDNEDD